MPQTNIVAANQRIMVLSPTRRVEIISGGPGPPGPPGPAGTGSGGYNFGYNAIQGLSINYLKVTSHDL